MNCSEFEKKYEIFLSKNRSIIVFELKNRYLKYCSDFSRFWRDSDFGGHVLLPLFVMWALWMFFAARSSGALATSIVTIIFVLFSLWLHHYWVSLAERICDRFFYRYEYKSIILLCTKWSKSRELREANSQEEIDCIDEFYEQCERYVVDEFFSYK